MARSPACSVGFSNGVFGLWTMPGGDHVHTLSISQHDIGSVAINSTGDWLAFASATLGQLLVWEWKTETCACAGRARPPGPARHSAPPAHPAAVAQTSSSSRATSTTCAASHTAPTGSSWLRAATTRR